MPSPLLTGATLIGVFVVCIVAATWNGMPVDAMRHAMEGGQGYALGIFIALLAGATVIAPLTTVPLVPLMAPVFGPFLTACAAVVGWSIGAIIAFLIARHAGRPMLERFVSFDTLARYESYIPQETQFVSVVLLRMIIPVDILSYVLGVVSSISLRVYILATVVGITPFAFIFSYLGDYSYNDRIEYFAAMAVGALVLLGCIWWYMVKDTVSEEKHERS